jgi:hypothetical protein
MAIVYPSLSIGAKARLAIFKREAAQGNWVRPMTWRDVRFAKLTRPSGIESSKNTWYASDENDALRRESRADEIVNQRHKGWYTDVDCQETAFGIIVRLPHGRIIAGYRWDANGETVYYPEIFTDAEEAARMADEHARCFAEESREHSEKCQAAQEVENRIDDSLARLRECIALRHRKCMAYIRNEISELIEKIRDDRETLATEFKDYV